MKRKNKTLALMLAAAIACLSLAACSSGENGGEGSDGSSEGDIPSISVDMSESAQTAPENAPESVSDTASDTGEPSAPETAETESTAPEETEPAENPETSIINTEETSETPTVTAAETSPETPQTPVGEANGISETALAMVGKPFYFGGADPETGFDNSGLMHYVLKANGIDCPRLTKDIAGWGETVPYDELKPGYLVFFEYGDSGAADFGGIYVGGGKMVVSTDEDKPVSEVDITTHYYRETFQFGIKTF